MSTAPGAINRPNCYECVYRNSVAGSAHSACHHPDTEDARGNSIFQLVGILGGGAPVPSKGWQSLQIVGDSYGIRRGWFGWPLNFDPVWLERCTGFQEKER